MMELLKQLQKKKKIIKVIFLITFIFFNYTSFLYAKVFSRILTIEGTFIQGGLLFGKTKPNSKIFFNDKKIFVNNEGDFLLGISRDEKKENLLILEIGNKVEKYNINIESALQTSKDYIKTTDPNNPLSYNTSLSTTLDLNGYNLIKDNDRISFARSNTTKGIKKLYRITTNKL